jgi:hypothetical protein
VLGLLFTVVLAKLDRYLTIKYDELVEEEYDGDAWIAYLKGRQKIYKIFILVSFLPYLNMVLVLVISAALLIIGVYNIFNSPIVQKILNKIF